VGIELFLLSCAGGLVYISGRPGIVGRCKVFDQQGFLQLDLDVDIDMDMVGYGYD
jgi:hypothetical protein